MTERAKIETVLAKRQVTITRGENSAVLRYADLPENSKQFVICYGMTQLYNDRGATDGWTASQAAWEALKAGNPTTRGSSAFAAALVAASGQPLEKVQVQIAKAGKAKLAEWKSNPKVKLALLQEQSRRAAAKLAALEELAMNEQAMVF